MEDCGCSDGYEKDWSKPTFTVLIKSLSSVLVTIYGDMFQHKTLNGLYLSSSNTYIDSLTTLDLYSNVKSISAKYPPITVFPVEKYDIVENYILQFELPSNLMNGNYDIIYMNDAGYFKASNTKRFTYFTLSGGLEPKIEYVPVDNVEFVDSDNDTYSDSIEIVNQTDPNNPDSYPVLLFNVFNNI